MSKNLYPIWKVIYEEFIYHEKVIHQYTIYVKPDEISDYKKLYSSYSLPTIQLALTKLKEIYLPRIRDFILDKNLPVMFELNGQIYSTTYVCVDQSCICGKHIEGNVHYGDILYEDDCKFDYIADTIFFYNEGEALVINNQLFLNGKLLLNYIDFAKVCSEIGQDINNLDYDADKLIKYIADNYPDATSYTCKGYTNFNIRGD